MIEIQLMVMDVLLVVNWSHVVMDSGIKTDQIILFEMLMMKNVTSELITESSEVDVTHSVNVQTTSVYIVMNFVLTQQHEIIQSICLWILHEV